MAYINHRIAVPCYDNNKIINIVGKILFDCFFKNQTYSDDISKGDDPGITILYNIFNNQSSFRL